MKTMGWIAGMAVVLVACGFSMGAPTIESAFASELHAASTSGVQFSGSVNWDEYLFIDAQTTPKSIKLAGEVKSRTTTSGFEVYRVAQGKNKYKRIATVRKPGKTLKYTDKKVRIGQRYKYKFRAYRYANGRKSYSKYSSAVSLRAVYRVGRYQVEFLTERNTTTDSLVMKVTSSKGNGRLQLSTMGTEFSSDSYALDIGLEIAGVSDDGVNWVAPTKKKVLIEAAQVKYVKFVPDAEAREDGVSTFPFAPSARKSSIDFWDSAYYNGFPAEFVVQFGKSKVRAYPNGEFYH